MATASRSLATALWRARFAIGLLPLSYTTVRDTTDFNARTRTKAYLSPAECPEDALICVRRVTIVGEVRLILIRSRENRQQLGKC